jgi:hypothetical protein
MKTRLRFYDDSCAYILVQVKIGNTATECKFVNYSATDDYSFSSPNQITVEISTGRWTHVCKYVNTRKL